MAITLSLKTSKHSPAMPSATVEDRQRAQAKAATLRGISTTASALICSGVHGLSWLSSTVAGYWCAAVLLRAHCVNYRAFQAQC